MFLGGLLGDIFTAAFSSKDMAEQWRPFGFLNKRKPMSSLQPAMVTSIASFDLHVDLRASTRQYKRGFAVDWVRGLCPVTPPPSLTVRSWPCASLKEYVWLVQLVPALLYAVQCALPLGQITCWSTRGMHARRERRVCNLCLHQP